MMLAITIFGIGSAKQKAMEDNVHAAVRELRIPIHLRHIEDVDQFMTQGITEIPSLMVDNKIVFKGKVPAIEELKKVITENYLVTSNTKLMNPLAPLSDIMSTNLIVVNPKDTLDKVKDIFQKNRIHHLPVVDAQQLLGMVSKTDFLKFTYGLTLDKDPANEINWLHKIRVEQIMTVGVAKLKPSDKISVAAYIFKENLFHAIPIVEDDKLVGIVTTYDLINYSFGHTLASAS